NAAAKGDKHSALTTVGPGEYFGVRSVLLDEPEQYTAVAQTPISGIVIAPKELLKALNKKQIPMLLDQLTVKDQWMTHRTEYLREVHDTGVFDKTTSESKRIIIPALRRLVASQHAPAQGHAPQLTVASVPLVPCLSLSATDSLLRAQSSHDSRAHAAASSLSAQLVRGAATERSYFRPHTCPAHEVEFHTPRPPGPRALATADSAVSMLHIPENFPATPGSPGSQGQQGPRNTAGPPRSRERPRSMPSVLRRDCGPVSVDCEPSLALTETV
ncbi:hypothetical protein CYMTET_34980, partial [Cymbomonas tetramitiformis]